MLFPEYLNWVKPLVNGYTKILHLILTRFCFHYAFIALKYQTTRSWWHCFMIAWLFLPGGWWFTWRLLYSYRIASVLYLLWTHECSSILLHSDLYLFHCLSSISDLFKLFLRSNVKFVDSGLLLSSYKCNFISLYLNWRFNNIHNFWVKTHTDLHQILLNVVCQLQRSSVSL